MARDYINYGTEIAATITLTGLAHTAGRECTAIVNDDATGKYTDYQCIVTLRTTTGTHGGALCCYAHMYGGTGTAYDGPVTGTDAAVTINTGMNLAGPFIINFGTSTTGLMSAKKTFLVSQAFGGEIPAKFGVVIENNTNVALDSTAGNLKVAFVPIYHTVT